MSVVTCLASLLGGWAACSPGDDSAPADDGAVRDDVATEGDTAGPADDTAGPEADDTGSADADADDDAGAPEDVADVGADIECGMNECGPEEWGGACGTCTLADETCRLADEPRFCCMDSNRNGSEMCDDSQFRVPDADPVLTIICINGRGGELFVSSRSGDCGAGHPRRCRCFIGDPWDPGNIEYLFRADCDTPGERFTVDLTAHVGETLWVGVHNQEDTGDGHMTAVCLSHD